MSVDLHIHSSASDGTLTPDELVNLARATGIGTIAITDHDSVQGITEALSSGARAGITVIPAVELSAETDGRSVHILGYFIDHLDQGLLQHLASLRETRLARAHELVRVLADGGYPIALEDVLSRAAGGSVGRAHVARALADAGLVPSPGAAFDRLIGRGKPYYVSKRVASPESVIATIRRAGGIAVLAHPAVSESEDLIGPLSAVGLEGVEVFHAQHTPADRLRLSEIAVNLNLTVTGGSDFHGSGDGRTRLGSGDMPDTALADFIRFAESRPGQHA